MPTPGNLVRLDLVDTRIPKALRGHYAKVLSVSANGIIVEVRMGAVRLKQDVTADACRVLSPDAEARLRYLLGNWFSDSADSGMLFERYRNRLIDITDTLRKSGCADYQNFTLLAFHDREAAWTDRHVREVFRTRARLERAWDWLLGYSGDLADAAFEYVGL